MQTKQFMWVHVVLSLLDNQPMPFTLRREDNRNLDDELRPIGATDSVLCDRHSECCSARVALQTVGSVYEKPRCSEGLLFRQSQGLVKRQSSPILVSQRWARS